MASVLRHFSIYSLGIMLSIPLGIVSMFLITKYLGPSLYGTFALFSLFLLYSRYFDLGLARGVLKIIPGCKDENEKTRLLGTSVFGTSALYLIIIATFIIVTKITGFYIRYQDAILLVFAVMVIQQIWILCENYLKATKDIPTIALSTVLMAVIKIPIVILLVKGMSLSGAVLMLFCVYAIAIAYMRSAGQLKFGTPRLSDLRPLFNKGFPILMSDLALFLLLTFDKIIVGRFLGTEQLGYYNIGFLIINYIVFLPTALGFVLLPRMIEEKKEDASAHFTSSISKLSKIAPAFIGFLFILLPALIRKYLTEYIPAILPMKIMLIGVFFFSLSIIASYYLIAIDQQRKLLFIQSISMAIMVSLAIIAIRLGHGIVGVAMASASSYLFMATCLLFACKKDVSVIMKRYVPIATTLLFCLILCPIVGIGLVSNILLSIGFITAYAALFIVKDKECLKMLISAIRRPMKPK